MQFVVKAYDGEGMLEKRMEVRPRHLEGMKRLLDHIICAGGLLDDEGKMGKGITLTDEEADPVTDMREYGTHNQPKVAWCDV